MSWDKRSYLSMSMNATSPDVNDAFVLEMSLVIWLNRQPVWQFECPMDYEKGYKNDRASLLHFAQIIHKARDAGNPLVVFNAPYEFRLFRRLLEEVHITPAFIGTRIIDPLVIDRHYQKNANVFVAPPIRFLQIMSRYGLIADGFDALSVAKATGMMLNGQLLHHKSLKTMSPYALHQSQEKWYEEWAVKFQTFCMKKNKIVWVPSWPFAQNAGDVRLELANARTNAIDADCAMDSISSHLYGNYVQGIMPKRKSALLSVPQSSQSGNSHNVD